MQRNKNENLCALCDSAVKNSGHLLITLAGNPELFPAKFRDFPDTLVRFRNEKIEDMENMNHARPDFQL